jgi:hypothetical protein
MLVDLRNVVDAALARNTKKTIAAPQPPVERAKAAAAGIQFVSSTSDISEFEVNAAPGWDQDSSAAEDDPEDKGL